MYTYRLYVRYTPFVELASNVNSFMNDMGFDEKLVIGEEQHAFNVESPTLLNDEQIEKLKISNETLTISRVELVE